MYIKSSEQSLVLIGTVQLFTVTLFFTVVCVCTYSLMLYYYITYITTIIILHELFLYSSHMKEVEKEVELAQLRHPRHLKDFISFSPHIKSMQVLSLPPFHR